ncbi:hypothetical protein [uncultured Streptococcus sp.]|uniref:hypothetical protein n=3 Tax=Streptococcus alactolyticus TaxID=29389 RepID=UPI0025FD9699|nr:hypothetical protein [uncultured Streptococcus sp.]
MSFFAVKSQKIYFILIILLTFILERGMMLKKKNIERKSNDGIRRNDSFAIATGGLMQQESISPVWLTKREKNISLDSEMFF